MSLFDGQKTFGSFAAQAFPYISVLVFFDILQLLLSGALRGASHVKVVMRTRAIVGVTVFLPLSLMCAYAPIANTLVKFILVYGSFYIANGVMSCVYIWRLRTQKQQHVQPAEKIKEHDGTYYPRRSPEVGRDIPDSR